jgi:hypothetical protein
MTITVEVALLGRPDRAFREDAIEWGERGESPDFTVPWDQRERVTVEVSESDTLGYVLDRAGEQFNLSLPGDSGPVSKYLGFIAFDHGGPVRLRPSLTLVDADGRATWGIWDWKAVSYKELLRANELKAFKGDPLRPLLILIPVMGNGFAIDWIGFLQAMWQVLQVISTVEGARSFAAQLLPAVSERLENGQPVLEDHSRAWTEQNGTPHEVRTMLAEGPWHPEDLAQLLGCTEQEAKSVLWALGYAERSGLWWEGGDEPAQVVGTLNDEVELSYSLGHEDYEQIVRDRTHAYLETGERALVPGLDAVSYGDMAAVPAPVPTDRDADGVAADTAGFLPLSTLRMACGCDKPECHILAEFGIANGSLKIGFSGPTDHFVINASMMLQIAGQVDFEIEHARNPAQASSEPG